MKYIKDFAGLVTMSDLFVWLNPASVVYSMIIQNHHMPI